MNIEELEANVAKARRRLAEAQEATERLRAARDETSGIMGHVLEWKRPWGNRKTVRIVVDRIGTRWGGDNSKRAQGFSLLKNGAIGIRREEVEIAAAKDLGRYIDPKSKDAEGRIIAETLQRGNTGD